MIEMDVILKSLTLDDLQENHREIAEIVGLDSFIKLCQNYAGLQIVVPTIKTIAAGNIKRRILKENCYLSAKELVQKYPISMKTAYRILEEKKGTQLCGEDDGAVNYH